MLFAQFVGVREAKSSIAEANGSSLTGAQAVSSHEHPALGP